MNLNTALQHRSLREQVYDLLRDSLNSGVLEPGAPIKLDRLAEQLGISRTPLRDALLRLEAEGFVTIKARSGVMVRRLTEQDIRNLYQLIGALEASVLLEMGDNLTDESVEAMEQANREMRQALEGDDFDGYYSANLALHDVYIGLSDNDELVERLKIMKQRLYDFPRKRDFNKEWELNSTREHEEIVAALKRRDIAAAAHLVQSVHWSFLVQESFIRQYYRQELEEA